MISNHAQFLGNLGHEPEPSFTSTGLARARFRLAVHDRQKGADGTITTTTFWVTVIGLGKQAELITQYLHKGSRVIVAGKLEPRTWLGSDGKERFDLGLLLSEIEFLDPRPQTANEAAAEEPVAEEDKELIAAAS